jgi:hypothetical protein
MNTRRNINGGKAGPSGMASGNDRGGNCIILSALFSTCAILLLLFPAGCGYRFAGDGESIPATFQTVFVDTFTNRTSEAYADTTFRTAFINQFVQNGRFRLARSRGDADVICRGTVKNLHVSPLAYKAGNLASEERLTITLEIFFEARESGRVIWTDSAYMGTGDYLVTTIAGTETNRKNALTKLADDTAERAYRLMMSGF